MPTKTCENPHYKKGNLSKNRVWWSNLNMRPPSTDQKYWAKTSMLQGNDLNNHKHEQYKSCPRQTTVLRELFVCFQSQILLTCTDKKTKNGHIFSKLRMFFCSYDSHRTVKHDMLINSKHETTFTDHAMNTGCYIILFVLFRSVTWNISGQPDKPNLKTKNNLPLTDNSLWRDERLVFSLIDTSLKKDVNIC